MALKNLMGTTEGRRHPAQELSQTTLSRCMAGVVMLSEGGKPLYQPDDEPGMAPDPILRFEANLRFSLSVIRETTAVPSKHFPVAVVRVREPLIDEHSSERKTKRKSYYFYEDSDKLVGGEPVRRVDMVEAVEDRPYPASLGELDAFRKAIIPLERDLYTENLEVSSAAFHKQKQADEDELDQDPWGVPVGERVPVLGESAVGTLFTGFEAVLSFPLHTD